MLYVFCLGMIMEFCWQNGSKTITRNKYKVISSHLSLCPFTKKSKYLLFHAPHDNLTPAALGSNLTLLLFFLVTSWYTSTLLLSFKHHCKAVFDHRLLLLAVTVSPLSPSPHYPSLCPRWEGSSAPSASPSTDPSVTPSCSCDTSARWRPSPGGSRRRCRRWCSCWTLVGTGRWHSWRLLLCNPFVSVRRGQSLGHRVGLSPWSLHSSSLGGMTSTMGTSLLSSWLEGEKRCWQWFGCISDALLCTSTIL